MFLQRWAEVSVKSLHPSNTYALVSSADVASFQRRKQASSDGFAVV